MHPTEMRIKDYFKNSRLAKMNDGSYCVIRELGFVPGGKGMKYHDNLLRLNARGVRSKFVELIGRFAKRLDDDGVREIPNKRVTATFESDHTGIARVARRGASSH